MSKRPAPTASVSGMRAAGGSGEQPSTAPVTGTRRKRVGQVALVIAVTLFVVTRLAFLDRDVPPWNLAEYQPIDEFGYTIPALNLHHYGTWTHQEVPYVPREGSPMNILESLVTGATLDLDWTYWGFRASSVLFALVAFAAMLATVRQLVRRARRDQVDLPFDPDWILVGAGLLLLVDFSFLIAGRIVEATIARLAVVTVLIWLVARGTFLGRERSSARTVVFGSLVGAAVWFVYVYNAFLIPGAVLAVALWAARGGTGRDVLRHVALSLAGIAASTLAYFAVVYLVYGHGPTEWYQTWLALYRESGRADSFDLPGIWTVLAGNIFRLDRPLMVVTLLALPSFVSWTRRTADSIGIITLSLAATFLAQCAIQSDYPERKMLLVMAFAMPIAAGGILRLGAWTDRVAARRWRAIFAVIWTAGIVIGTLLLILPPSLTHWSALVRLLRLPIASTISYREGLGGTLIALGAIVGTAAAVTLVVAWRRRVAARVAGVVLLTSMLLPLIYLDTVHVFTNVSTTYRDAMVKAGDTVDGQVTAGGLSFAMQLYNTGRPVLEGYPYGMSMSEYQAAVVRFFQEGRATSLFSYADGSAADRWATLGFRLVERYPIELPKGQTMGRYVYDPPAAGAP